MQLLGWPSNYIRSQLNTGKQLTESIKDEFKRLRHNKEIQFVKQDLQKESKIAKEREKRMERMKERLANRVEYREQDDEEIKSNLNNNP